MPGTVIWWLSPPNRPKNFGLCGLDKNAAHLVSSPSSAGLDQWGKRSSRRLFPGSDARSAGVGGEVDSEEERGEEERRGGGGGGRRTRGKMSEERPVPRRESPWGLPEGDTRQPKAHRCNDRAEDVVQACFEGNPFKTVPGPFKLFWQCMRSKPGEEPTEPYTYLQLDPPRRVEVNLEQTASES